MSRRQRINVAEVYFLVGEIFHLHPTFFDQGFQSVIQLAHAVLHPADPSCPCAVALVDARYLRWLAGLADAQGVSLAALPRSSLNELLHHALQRTGARAALLRTHWYSDTDGHAVCDDQTLRMLPSQDSDGAALVRQMSADLQTAALRGLPPEVDRELLLRGKNALNRSLNFHEKRWMREHARQTALGQGQAGGDARAAAVAAASE